MARAYCPLLKLVIAELYSEVGSGTLAAAFPAVGAVTGTVEPPPLPELDPFASLLCPGMICVAPGMGGGAVFNV